MGLEVKSTGYFDHLGRSIGFPIANQGDGGTYRITYQCFFGIHATQSQPVQIIGGADTIIQLSGGDWVSHGIVAGDVITFSFSDYENVTTISGSATVVSLDGGNLRINESFPYQMVSMNGYLYVNKTPQAIETDFNLIPSTQSSGFESIVDTSVTRFRANDLASLAVSSSAIYAQMGQKSGSIVEEVKVTRLANETDPISGGAVLQYQVDIKFKWWGYLSELFQDYFFNAKTITPIVGTRIFPQFNNYGIQLESIYKLPTDGNSGFRNENFNQGISEFQLTSFGWKDVNDNIIAAFDYSQPCKFSATIQSQSGFGTNFGLIFFNDIQDLSTISAGIDNDNGQYSLDELTILGQIANLTTSSVGSFDTVVGKYGEQLSFSDITISVVGNTATIEGECTPNQEFIDRFSDDNNLEKRFALLFRSETSTFPQPNYSTTVNTTLWVGRGEIAPVVLGAYPFAREEMLSHSGLQISGKFTMIEDDNRYNARFWWKRNRRIIAITFRNVVLNSNGEWFTLESYRIPLPPTIDWLGVQQMPNDVFSYFANNMPVMMTNSGVNSFLVALTGNDNPDEYEMRVQFPMLQRWEYWLPQNGVAPIFANTANKDWFNYSQISTWHLATCIEIEVEEGTYRNFYDYKMQDYDWQSGLECDFSFERLDATVVSSPLAGEVCKVVATWTFGEPITIDWGQITVEPFESSPRWMLSTEYFSPNQPLSPLFNDNNAGQVEILNNGTTSVSLVCYLDANKINTTNGIKFTSRVETNKSEVFDREFKVFRVVQLPAIPKKNDKYSQCCDCEPWLVLAHETESDFYKNDFTSVFHKLDTEDDTCEFKIYKDGVELPNYGVAITAPNDSLLTAYCYNWRDYLITYGGGCYTIKKHLNIVGIDFEIEEGHYQLMPWNNDTSEGTTRICGQYNKEVQYMEYGVVKRANFSDSGFETCIRFNGYFGSWQPNAEIINHYAWNGALRNAKIRYKGTYALTMNATTICRYEKLTKEILLFSSLLKCSDYNFTNNNQRQDIIWTLLNDEESIDIQYYEDSRKASVVLSLRDMWNNEVSRFDGSINPVNGVSYALATIGTSGEAGSCLPAQVVVNNSLNQVLASQSIASGGASTILAPNATVVVKTVSNVVVATQQAPSGATTEIVIADPNQVELTVNNLPFITAVAPIQDIGIVNEYGGYGAVTTNYNDIIIPNEEVEIYVNDVLHSTHSAAPFEINVINITI